MEKFDPGSAFYPIGIEGLPNYPTATTGIDNEHPGTTDHELGKAADGELPRAREASFDDAGPEPAMVGS